MTIYIDTNTFSAVPSLYADEDKNTALPRVIPSVLLNEGIVRFGFLGDYAPAAGSETVCVVASIPEPGNPLRVLTSYGTQVGDLWEVPINFDATEIADALVNRGSVNLSMGVIVEGADTRREFQFWIQCFSSSQGEISPEETADAKTFADAARLSADNAAESESNAAQSATNAANSASAAAESATNASNSATNAAQSASNAADSASAAKTSETNAKTSETNAAQSKEDAQTAASASAQSASNAAESESAARTFAANASNSASNAAQSASNAADSASAAKTSETNAKASETAAKSSQTAAANSASSASTSATNAANSASAADTSANNAAGSATAAAGSAGQAAQSAEQAAETLENVYTKPEIDGVDTGAEVTLKMNEIIAQLKEYEADTGDVLPFDFWEEVMRAFQQWQENPTEVKQWETTSSTASTSPYFDTAPSSHVVDFNVSRVRGYGAVKGTFCTSFDFSVFVPEADEFSSAFFSNQKVKDIRIIAPKAQSVSRAIQNAQYFTGVLYTPRATNWSNAFQGAIRFNSPVPSKNGTNLNGVFYTAYVYNQPTPMNSADTASGAFFRTAMSPANIAATLDTLPEKTDGKSRPIMFSRYDGTKLAPLMAESPYKESVDAAVARGWTVQFD